MAGRNDYIVFNQSMSNIMSQVDYATNAQVINGLPGNNIAVSPLHNKLYRQASTMAAGIGQFIMDSGFIAQDVDVVALSQALKNAIAVNIPEASDTVRGTVMRATNAEIITGTNNDKFVTIKGLKDNWQSILPTATTTQKGVSTLATVAEAQTGIDQNKIITPYTMAQAGGAHIPDATTTIKGKDRLANQTEVNAGLLTTTIVTPNTLKNAMSVLVPDATDIIKGKSRFATNAEVIMGLDNTTMISPKTMRDYAITAIPNATNTVAGISMFATRAEVDTGTNNTKAATALSIAGKAPLNSPVFTGTPTTQGKFTSLFKDTIYAQGMFRNIWIYQSNPPPNTVGEDGDLCFLRS